MPEKRDLPPTAPQSPSAEDEKKGSGRVRWGRRTATGSSTRRTAIRQGPVLRRIRDLLGDYSEQTGAFF
ncbi:MAG: hypothetical protein WBH85_13310 [Thermoanaerobaculia bacterium]